MRRIILGLFFLIHPPLLIAQPQPWMKQANPNELGMFLLVSNECRIDVSSVEAAIKSEFLRARVRPTEDLQLGLVVEVSCIDVRVAERLVGQAIAVAVRFGTGESGVDMLYAVPKHGGVGTHAAEDFESDVPDYISDLVSVALSDYLEANL